MNQELFLPLFIALPLGAAFIIPLIGLVWEKAGGVIAVIINACLLIMAIGLIGKAPIVSIIGGWKPPFGINLVGDGLSSFFLLIVTAVSLLVAIYSLSYMKQYTAGAKFYSLFMLMITGMCGVIMTGDLFNMFVFLEIAAISSYALVAFGIEHEELEASFKYLVLGGLASSFILFGIAILYSRVGSLNLAHIGSVLDDTGRGLLVQFVAALFIMGFGVKAALVPFHAWLPDAHPSAPAPISAMLSGLLIKVLGLYCIIRLFYTVFGFDCSYSYMLIYLGILSMVGGGILAVGQGDFKRLLAYSSISQMGYIMLAFGLGTPLGIIGGLFHTLNHAVFKSLLFLCSGAVEYATGTRDLKQLGGLWRKMPVTGATCSIASLSISAVPPFGGFFSKLIIIFAAVGAVKELGSLAYVSAFFAVLVSFITLVTFVKAQKMILFGSLPVNLSSIHEVPKSMMIALVFLAVFCILLGIACPWFMSCLVEPAREVLLNRAVYIANVLE